MAKAYLEGENQLGLTPPKLFLDFSLFVPFYKSLSYHTRLYHSEQSEESLYTDSRPGASLLINIFFPTAKSI